MYVNIKPRPHEHTIDGKYCLSADTDVNIVHVVVFDMDGGVISHIGVTVGSGSDTATALTDEKLAFFYT